MLYDDARHALNEFLSRQYFAKSKDQPGPGAGGGGTAGTIWVTQIAEGSPIAATVSASARTSDGREDLLELHKLATEAAKVPDFQNANLSPTDRKLFEAIARWQILSKNSLLQAQFADAVPASTQNQLRLATTTDLSKFRLNLTEVDAVLKQAPKSSSQQRLSDDVNTLRSLPATGSGAAAANKVIEGWR